MADGFRDEKTEDLDTERKINLQVRGDEVEVTGMRKAENRLRPARSKLPWFRCLHCRTRLAQMDVIAGKTCVRVSAYAVSYKTELTCEHCGATREFVSMADL